MTKDMKRVNRVARAGAMILASACVLSPVAVFAGPKDTINESATGSVSLYKYDMTAAKADGVDLNQFSANGKVDSDAESKLNRYRIGGVEFSYVKVADIENSIEHGDDSGLCYGLDDELVDILGIRKHEMPRSVDDRSRPWYPTYTSTEINEGLKKVLTEGSTETKNKLENYLKKHGAQTMTTDENGHASASNLDLGLYLFVETKTPANVSTTTDPFFVSVPMTDVEGDDWFYDVTVYPKNQSDVLPTLDKKVRQHDDAALYHKTEYADTATASQGDVLDYIFVSRVPRITSEATYLKQFEFVDTMAKGLKYNKDASVYFYNTKEDAEANDTSRAVLTWDHGSANFTENYTDNSMDVAVTDAGLAALSPAMSEKYMVVSYSATVSSDASVVFGDNGNENNVTLTWKRTSDAYPDVIKDKAKVYSFGLNITKSFDHSDKTPDATKVKFVLQNKTDGHYIKATKVDDGSYYVTDGAKGAEESEGTVFTPNADGQLIVNGLEADNYLLTETHTSDGYQLLKSPVEIHIFGTDESITPSATTSYDTEDKANNPRSNVLVSRVDDASATVDGTEGEMSAVDGSDNARVDVYIVNTPGFRLPATGGTGTILFTIGGCIAALGGVAVLTKKKSKKNV